MLEVSHETTQTPERSLLVALLRRALFDYFGGSASEKESAKEWIFDVEEDEQPFAFSWVCDHLDMNPERVRKYVTQTKLTSSRPTIEWWMRNISAN